MANIEEAIRRLQFLYETHGAEEVAAAQRAITASTTTTEKASLSLEKSFNNLERRYISTVKAQQDYSRVAEKVNDAIKQNPALAERGNAILQAAQTQYIRAAQGAGTYGQAVQQMADGSRLARHEMINLSRQIQDVGVSLASGQSPLTVAIQQGAQIADVFATSSGTVMGFFRQAGSWAAGFATSAAGMATAAGTALAAWLVAGAQFKAGQNDIERALAGMGAASGVTAKQINEIASASSSAFGLSTSEARTAATAFASTGRIYEENIKLVTGAVSDFAKATGTDAADATKKLAAAMVDPAKGAEELNKQLNFLDAGTLTYIRSLQAQGKEQEAQKALMDALNPKLQKMAEHTSALGKAYDLAANAASNFWQYAGKAAPLGPSIPAPWEDSPKETANKDRLKLLSTDALAAERSIMGVTVQIENLQQQLSKLAQQRLTIEGTGATDAERVGNVRLQQLREQSQEIVRQADATRELAALYPGMSIEVAKQLDAMNGQLLIAQTRSGAEQIVTQEYINQNNYLLQGKSLEEAITLAAMQRQTAEENVSKSIANQIQGLEDQIALSKARINGTEAATKAQQAYNKAIRDGASETDAQALKSKTLEAERQRAIEQTTRSQDNYTEAVHQSSDAISGATDGMQHMGWETAHVTMQAYQMVDAFDLALKAFHRLPMADQIDQRLRDMPTQFGNEQFTIETDPLKLQAKKAALEQAYGAGNVEAFQQFAGTTKAFTDYRVSQSYLDAQNAKGIEGLNVSSPSAIQSSLQQVLSMGNTDAANRLIDFADPSQQGSLIQQTIDYIRRTEPPGLATEEKIQIFNDKLEQLAGSTDSLNATMQSALSPFYSQDPRTTKLGFRAGVTGNPDWATGAGNANPLVAVLGPGATAPGMAGGGSFVVGGGYSANDNRMAVFPVASGEEIVVNRNKEGTGGQVVHIDNRIFVSGNVDNDALSKMKVSRYQQAQRMRAGMAQA